MSWEVLQQALGGQAAPTPLGLIKCCRGAGEHQAIAALMIAHALGRDTFDHTLCADVTVLSFGRGVCLLHQTWEKHPSAQLDMDMAHYSRKLWHDATCPLCSWAWAVPCSPLLVVEHLESPCNGTAAQWRQARTLPQHRAGSDIPCRNPDAGYMSDTLHTSYWRL